MSFWAGGKCERVDAMRGFQGRLKNLERSELETSISLRIYSLKPAKFEECISQGVKNLDFNFMLHSNPNISIIAHE